MDLQNHFYAFKKVFVGIIQALLNQVLSTMNL